MKNSKSSIALLILTTLSLLLALTPTATAQVKHAIPKAPKEISFDARLKMLHKRFSLPTLKRIFWEGIQAEYTSNRYTDKFERDNPEPSTTNRDYQTQIKAWMQRRVRAEKTRGEIQEREEEKVMRKWKITRADLGCISGEGLTDKWPMPPEKRNR